MRFFYDIWLKLTTLVQLNNGLLDSFIRLTIIIGILAIFYYRLIIVHKIIRLPLFLNGLLIFVTLISLIFDMRFLELSYYQISLGLIYAIPSFIAMFYGFKNPSLLYEKYKILLIPSVIYTLLLLALFLTGSSDTGYQALAYYLLPFLLISLWESFSKRSFLYLSYFFLLFMIIFIYGGRGAVLAFLLCLIFILVFQDNTIRKYFTVTFLLFLLTLLFLFWEPLLSALALRFPESRSLQMIQLDKFNSIDSRTEIFSLLMQEAYKNPILINGYGANHVYLNGIYKGLNSEFPITGTHAHNFFVALLFDWGIIVGGIISIIVIVLLLISIFKVRLAFDQRILITFCIIILTNFIHAMVSGSYAVGGEIWISLGAIFGMNFSSKSNFKY